MTDLRFPVILADPPWHFSVYSEATGSGRSASRHYDTMSRLALETLDVPSIMAKDCALFMWTTWTHLPQALALGQAWGLTYKSCAFLWAKQNAKAALRPSLAANDKNWFMSLGYWSRGNTEPCLLFTQGHPKRLGRDVRQLIVAPRRAHSQKPDEQYALIERLVAGPYVELFARQPRAGWSMWGNEVESTIEIAQGEIECPAMPC